jgi:hypothetical protein
VSGANPGHAEDIAQSITYDFAAWVLACTARAMSAANPARAARLTARAKRIAQLTSDELYKVSAVAGIADAVAAAESDRAEDITQSMSDDTDGTKAMALARTARAMAAANPARAARLTTDADRAAQSITNEYSKAMTLARIAEAAAATDPARTS